MLNPYANHGANLENAATRLIAITPDDVNDLAQVIKGLRIYNPNASPADVQITTVDGDTVVVSVPAASLWIEPVVISRVWATNTTTGIVLHGLTD